MEAGKILSGYKEAIEDSIWELVSYIARNRRCLNLADVRNRCEHLISQIDEYMGVQEQAKAILKEWANGQRKVAGD